MIRLYCFFAACLLISSLTGCAGFLEYHRDQQDARRDRDMRSDHVDTLWKQGYGFNNPNPARVRQGLDPVNLDGKTDRERKDNYFSRVFGDMIVYGVKTAFASVADRLRR